MLRLEESEKSIEAIVQLLTRGLRNSDKLIFQGRSVRQTFPTPPR